MNAESTDLLRGTLDLLILQVLELDPRHGLGISDRIAQVTHGTFVVQPGSLFPALHRLEQKGWLVSEWGESENRRKAKFYALTRSGRARLEKEKENWRRVALAVGQVLEAK